VVARDVLAPVAPHNRVTVQGLVVGFIADGLEEVLGWGGAYPAASGGMVGPKGRSDRDSRGRTCGASPTGSRVRAAHL
jgi:hypothetical protein